MQQTLEAAENEETLEIANVSHTLAQGWSTIMWSSPQSRAPITYSVDEDGGKDSGSHSRPVRRIVLAANEFGMVTLEEEAEDRQDDDGKYRNDKAGNGQVSK